MISALVEINYAVCFEPLMEKGGEEMLKLSPWMYFVMMVLSFLFLMVMVIIDALVFGTDSITTIAAFVPLALAFISQIDRKEK